MTDNWNFDDAKVRIAKQHASDLKSALNFIISMYSEFTTVPEEYKELIRDQYNQIRFYTDCLLDQATCNEESRTFVNQS